MRKKILILGSSGMIGSYLSNYLKKKYQVIYFDIVNSKKQDLRIKNNKELINKVKKSDFIYFLAFDVGGSTYLKKYQNTCDFINNNLKIMLNTFDVIKKFKKKFIFASSQMSNMDFSSYGHLKAIGEKYTSILGGITVKFWNVYGYEYNEEKMHVVNDFIRKGFKYGEIRTLTDGNESRDFLFGEDCSKALEVVMKKFHLLKKHQSIDIAYNKFFKIRLVAKIIQELFLENRKKIKITYSKNKDIIQKYKKNYPNKIINKYWNPNINLESGISKIFNSYIKNRVVID
jgi:nucleoside-diphosphate-sugar epimerase